MNKPVADKLAQTLAEAGVEIVFGLPGGEVVAVLDALRRQNIRFVLTHNESTAVFMADATARLSGKPGVCLTTLGPGATNAVAGVSHAYLDRAPVLIITAQMPAHLHDHHTHQLIDIQALYQPITKGSYALTPHDPAGLVRAALGLCTNGRPGPVHLQIDKETAEATSLDQPSPALAQIEQALVSPADSTAEQIATAQAQLSQAQRPVILAGLGLEPEAPYEMVRALAESLNAPVITTPKGKGALADDHPLAAGTLGLTRTDPVYEILDEADCIIALGFDVVELVKPWDQTQALIWLAPWANDAPRIESVVDFVGPMAPVMAQLADSATPPNPTWGAVRVQTFRDKQARQALPNPAPNRLRPQTVFQLIRGQVPRETPVAVDVGSHKILGSLSWPTLAPNSFFVSNGLSSMGFALPTTLAAALQNPHHPAICFTGDAGMAMVIGELAILAQHQLPVIIVVFNDAAIDLIRAHQVRSGYPIFGTEFIAPNFAEIAVAYGIIGHRVSTEADCLAAIDAAIASNRPALIEAMIDPVSYPTTPPALKVAE